MSLLITDVTVGDRPGRAVHVADGRIAWLGDAADAPAADRVVAGEGALLTPAFVDAHVHATATGLALTGLDLSSSSSLAEAGARIARHAQDAPGTVLGTGWDETGWPERRGLTRADLDAVLGYRAAYVARVDVHSATVSTALLDRIPGIADLPGFSADGRLRLDAHHAARRAAYGSVGPDQRRAAQRAARAAAAALGIGSLHEMAGPEVSGADDLAGLLELAAAEPGPEVVGYWGELAERGGLDVVRELGLAGAGGDLFCDGALGSHTAALGSGPYADRPDTAGTLRFATGQLVHHVRTCTLAGIQAGFHVIGDAAVAQVVFAVETVAAELGRPAVRACRHRLEHVEMIDPVDIERLRDLGMVASVQPAFDAAWGGDAGMYAERLGAERALRTNPFAGFADAGVALALGSDAPVTPLDPWGGVHAAVDHRTPASGLRPFDAFDAATHGGRAAARAEHPAGPLGVGAPASLALWETAETLSAVLAGRHRPACRLLLVNGDPL
ncbi:amidohydrolase [Geodermatophilus sp. SYSU D00815]